MGVNNKIGARENRRPPRAPVAYPIGEGKAGTSNDSENRPRRQGKGGRMRNHKENQFLLRAQYFALGISAACFMVGMEGFPEISLGAIGMFFVLGGVRRSKP